MAAQTQNKVNRIKIDEAARQMNEIVFVDARSATALKRIPKEIPGAIHVPVKQLEESLGRVPRNRKVVTYCT